MDQTPTTDINSNPTSRLEKKAVDLALILKRYAWGRFCEKKPIKHLTLREKDVVFDIVWKDVQFVHDQPIYKKINSNPQKPSAPTTLVLYSTVFDNNTGRPQNYSFQTQKSTTSTLQVDVEECVTIEHELSLSLKAPGDLMEMGAGFKREKAVTKLRCETDEETLTWGGDSDIQVDANCAVSVSLQVEERSDDRRYEILSHMYGPVSISILQKKDQKPIKTYGWTIEEIVDEKATIQEKKILKIDNSKKVFPFKVVNYITTGTATFKYGASQRISVEENDIAKTGTKADQQNHKKQTPL